MKTHALEQTVLQKVHDCSELSFIVRADLELLSSLLPPQLRSMLTYFPI